MKKTVITLIALCGVLLIGQETQNPSDQPKLAPEQQIVQLQQRLQEKDAMIRSLQAQLKTTAKLYGDCANELTNDEQQLTLAKK